MTNNLPTTGDDMNNGSTVVSTVPQPNEGDEHDPLYVNTEAASTNFYWTFGKAETFNLQTTFRGNPQAVEIEAHLAAVVIALTHIVEMHGHAKPVGQQASQTAKPATVTTPAQAAIETGKMIPPPPPVVTPPANGGAQSGQAVCAMIEVGTAYKSGKTQLKFYCAEFEKPLSYTKSIDDMARLLAPLGFAAAHIVVGQRYPTHALVSWQQNGEYKNVMAVSVAA